MSDSEIDDLQHFEAARQKALYQKAGIDANAFQPEELSDEEVLGLRSESEDESGQEGYYEQDDETVAHKRERTNRELDGNWGSTRDNYFGGEDDIGEDEGASEEEEAEALRLQRQELEDMGADDFVDEDDLESWKTRGEVDEDGTEDSPVRSIDPSAMTGDERKEFLQAKFPAVLLLSGELAKFPDWESELAADAQAGEKPQTLLDAGRAALATYKGMIYSFFALFSDRLRDGDLAGLAQLEEHPVNEALLLSRQLWLNYRNAGAEKADAGEDEAGEQIGDALGRIAGNSEQPGSDDDEVSEDQLSDDMSDMSDAVSDDHTSPSDGNDSDASDEFALSKPAAGSKARKQVGDFDETADTIEEQARAKNKQSLRFYTSQIGKNDRSRQAAYSGDDDLPYRERDFERRQRLMAEAKKRGEQRRDTFDDEDDINDFSASAAPDNAALGLYNEAQRQREAAKQQKHQRHAEALEASRAGRLAEYLAENPDADKRAINYQIEKNKGLTKKRKKENRNARVKKRVRYEAAQKKLKGVRKVYTGPQGPYQGELSGIRKNLSHSSKFKS